MKLFSTRVHGVLDYLTAGTLLTLPRVLGWSDKVTTVLTGAAINTLTYSLFTRYELGLFKLLPMRGHLVLDAISGAAFCGAPLLFPDEDTSVKATLVAIGVFELIAALSTDTEPGLNEQIGEFGDALPNRFQDVASNVRERMAGA